MRLLLALLAASSVALADSPPPASADEVAAPEEDRLTPEQVRMIELAFVELPPPQDAAPPEKETDFASVIRFGEMRLESGDFKTALIAFDQAGRGTERIEEREAALAGLARTYRQSGDLVKAVATYERLIADHAGTPGTPLYLLELGRTLRAVGAPKLAIARFYSVLHAVIKVPPGQSANYRQIARTAQFEIAETHFLLGNYEEAARFFTRLNLLDLAPVDRTRAQFKAALSRARAGDTEKAIGAYRRFISQHPEDDMSAEARFQLATLLREAGRNNESRDVTLDLLRRQQALAGEHAERWTYWQRRTGNQLGNDFYNQGDFTTAFAIYRSLAELGGEPRWRLPVLYQMALCQERLLQTGAARELYQQIRTEAGETPPPELAELAQMAEWRMGQLDWVEQSNQKLEVLALPLPADAPSRS